MMNKKKLLYTIFGCFLTLFCATGGIFANTTVNTILGISPPPYEIVYEPPYITGIFTSGFVYVSITGNGIRPNSSGIWNNGTYNFQFYRGTGPFTTGSGHSSGNLRSLLTTTTAITRVDNTSPTFGGVAEGVTYSSPVTITFSDTSPGVTATLNGNPFSNGTTISNNGTYQLIVTDTVGNSTGATFIIYLNGEIPSGGGAGGGYSIIKDNCTLPSNVACANQGGNDYSASYYDNTCCISKDYGLAVGTRTLTAELCKTRSCYSYYYDDVCGPCTPPKYSVLPTDWPSYHYTTPTNPTIKNSAYSQERNDVYLRAYRLGITTVPTIENADLEGVIYRKFAAKMASEFAINVVGLKPDNTKVCEFSDISKEIPELQYYIRLACKLGIMGLDYYGDEDRIFNPNYVVTRDQLVTILSRTLWGDTYNLQTEEITFYDKIRNFLVHTVTNISNALGLNIALHTPLDWYTKHLEAIKKLGIMTDYTPSLREFRIYVMIIMYKIDNMGIKSVQKLGE